MDKPEIECTECGWQGHNSELLCSDEDRSSETTKYNICPECYGVDCCDDYED